jgi:hypothetical protein
MRKKTMVKMAIAIYSFTPIIQIVSGFYLLGLIIAVLELNGSIMTFIFLKDATCDMCLNGLDMTQAMAIDFLLNVFYRTACSNGTPSDPIFKIL